MSSSEPRDLPFEETGSYTQPRVDGLPAHTTSRIIFDPMQPTPASYPARFPERVPDFSEFDEAVECACDTESPESCDACQ